MTHDFARPFRLATWNVNSIRARLDRVLSWCDGNDPDVLLLQEIKVEDKDFPRQPFLERGYHIAVYGQKSYNGVATLAKDPLYDVRMGLDDTVTDPQARLLAARVGPYHVVNLYAPNGESVGSDKFAYKMQWLERFAAYMKKHYRQDDAVVVGGDFNIAPTDSDVAKPDSWKESVLTDKGVRQLLQTIFKSGWLDLYRTFVPEGTAVSWWDYRSEALVRNDGLRIDLLLGNTDVAEHVKGIWVDRFERRGPEPSDHAPVVVDLQRLT